MKVSNIKEYDMYLANSIGTMLEIANNKDFDINRIWNLFINSNLCKQIENNNCIYTTLSGIDFINILIKDIKNIESCLMLKLNKYYWAGWVLSQYQQYSNLSFKKINTFLPIKKVIELFNVFHEQDVSNFFKYANLCLKKLNTNLKQLRIKFNLSQKELSVLCGVKLRTIQMLEQRNLNINKTQVDTLIKFAKVLNCKIEDLLE